MSKPSREQVYLLRRIEQREMPDRYAVRRFHSFLEDKPVDEQLDARWRSVWDRLRRVAQREVPESALQLMEDAVAPLGTDDAVWKIKASGDTKVVFLVGAGASVPSDIPAIEGLLSLLWKRARRIGREDIDALVTWCEKRDISNIEDLLTAAYISNFAADNPRITGLLNYFLFSGGEEADEERLSLGRRGIRTSPQVDTSSIRFLQDTLQTLFGLLTDTMISASPNEMHLAIASFAERHKDVAIITTNYDGCMDEALLNKKMAPVSAIDETAIEMPSSRKVELIKMHGSIQWSYCDSCQDFRQFNLLELKELYRQDKISYPVIGICKNCGGLRRPLLVPPLSFKLIMFPQLIDIWNQARERIDKADYLIVVGYSFSEADTYITKIISRSMSLKKAQKILVVNPDPQLAPALRERFTAHIDGFQGSRVLSLCSKGEDALPKLLKSMVAEEKVGATKKPRAKKRVAKRKH